MKVCIPLIKLNSMSYRSQVPYRILQRYLMRDKSKLAVSLINVCNHSTTQIDKKFISDSNINSVSR